MNRLFWVSLFALMFAVQSACSSNASIPTPTATIAAAAIAAPSLTPAVTPTSLPTVTAIPSPTATATQPPAGPFAAFIGGQQLTAMQQRLEKTTLDYLKVISVDIGRRLSGSAEEAKAAEYLKQEFESFGYQTSIQEFQTQIRNGGSATPVPLNSRNVIAIKPGANSSSPILVLGGHFDTVAAGPGANDNGSGTAVLLTIAKELSKVNLGYEIRFVSFGSEEIGLIGSREFVRSLSPEDKARIQAMINFDALAGGTTSIIIGSPDLVRTASTISSLAGIKTVESELPPNTSSDHFNFQRDGIPVVYFAADDYSKIHTPQDTIENVTPRLLGEASLMGYLMTRQLISPQPLGTPGI